MSEASWKKEFYPVEADLVDKKDAIKHSLVKWYGLRKVNLEKHGLDVPPIDISGDTCALCQWFEDYYSQCEKCPLSQSLGKRCSGIGSVYASYVFSRDPEPMIAELEVIRFIEKTCK